MKYSVAAEKSRSEGSRDHGARTSLAAGRGLLPRPTCSFILLFPLGRGVLSGRTRAVRVTPKAIANTHVSKPRVPTHWWAMEPTRSTETSGGNMGSNKTEVRTEAASCDGARSALREDGFPRTGTHVGGDPGFAGLQWAVFSTRHLVTTTQVNKQNIVNRQVAPTGPPQPVSPEQTRVLGSRFRQIVGIFSFYVKQNAPSTVQPLNDKADTAWATSTGYFQ